jgi:hypothetical protein
LSAEVTEKFEANNGRLMGAFGLVVCAAIIVLLAREASPHAAVRGISLLVVLGILFWAALLRPRVWVQSTDLRMQTMLESVTIPLASIETALVRRYLLVRSGGEKFICPAIGRSLRKTVRSEMKWSGSSRSVFAGGLGAAPEVAKPGEVNYADFVEQRIERLAREDRARLGIEERSEEEYALGADVRRERAWPEIAGLAVFGLVFVVSLFV